MKILVPVLILITLFDGVMGVLTHIENVNIEKVDPWLYQQQVIEPSGDNNGKTVILFHGFVGSPNDFKPIASKIAGMGYKVILPVTPGQVRGNNISKKDQLRANEYLVWAKSIVHKEYEKTGVKPIVIGFSMGGALASVVAVECEIERLVLLSPFYELPVFNDLIKASSYVFSLAVPIVPKSGRGKINSPEGYEAYTPGTFFMSLNAFLELQKLAKIASASAKSISVPVLVIGSANDETASFELTKDIFAERNNVILKEYDDSNHILLYDYDSDKVVNDILVFLKENN